MHTQRMEILTVDDGEHIVLRGRCTVTGEPHTSAQITMEQLEAYEAGALAQVAFPHLSDEDREFLISGVSPEGWRKLFSGSEE